MDTAKQLVGALEKADWLDRQVAFTIQLLLRGRLTSLYRLLVFGAFTFFLLVVVWVVGQRTVGRGLRVMWWLTGGLRSSSSVKESIRKAALEKASEKAKHTIAETVGAVRETASVLSVASSSIASVASVVAAIKSGPPTVEVPDPSPTPTLVPVEEAGKISEVLEDVVPPEPEPSPLPVVEGTVGHDEL